MKYYCVKYNSNIELLNENQKTTLNSILKNKVYAELFPYGDYNYLIFDDELLIGLFTLIIKDDYVFISSIYLCEEHRNQGIATNIIQDIIISVKYNYIPDIKYVCVNSYVESALFFLNRGFNLCKRNKKIDYKKKNIIILYKKI